MITRTISDITKKLVRDAITEPDNNTICPVRVIAIVGSIQYLAMAALHFHSQHVWEPQSFAIGFGSILGAAGVALGLKKDSPAK